MATEEKAARPSFASALAAIALLWAAGLHAHAAEPHRLTTDGTFKFSPAFTSREGNELVYVLFEKPTQFRLMRLKLDDLSVEPVHKEISNSEFGPAFSPDGRYFVYVHNRTTLSMVLVIRDNKEDTQAEVPPAPGFAGMVSPAVAPDGSRVLYSFADEGRQQIYSVDMHAADRKALTDSTGVNNWPSYSPDGKHIAFGSTRDGNYEIYVMDADGSNVRRLTHYPYQDIRPRFSPDGKRFAFTSMRDGNFEVCVMNADGTGLVRVTNNPERDDYPEWHPDGRRLVIVSERSGRHDLYLVDVPELDSGGRPAKP